MSRTERNHWMRENMRDGVKRTKVKRRKEFLPEEGEFDVYEGLPETLSDTCEWTCLTCGVEVEYGAWECEECK